MTDFTFFDRPPRMEPTYWELHSGDLGLLVKINMQDGSIEFGERYTPDEAAKVFWQAIQRFRREGGHHD